MKWRTQAERDAEPLGSCGEARDWFGRWVSSPETTIAMLIRRLEWPYWRDPVVVDPVMLWRLGRDDLAAIKAEVVRRVEAAGGRVEVGAVVVAVVEGELGFLLA